MRVGAGIEQLFFTTVPIITQLASDRTQTRYGTGFLFSYESPVLQEQGQRILFLVTNKHVIADASGGYFWMTVDDGQGQPIIGRRHDIQIDDFERVWHGHPNDEIDIAIMPMRFVLDDCRANNIEVFYRVMTLENIPTSEAWDDMDGIEEVTFIGYPRLIFDPVSFAPVARRGTTASLPSLDYAGLPQLLIDASVFPGSSGSPVFLAGTALRSREGRVQFIERMQLLGVISSVFTLTTEGVLKIEPIPTHYNVVPSVDQMIDLGVVFKSRTVVETIEDFLRMHGYEHLIPAAQ